MKKGNFMKNNLCVIVFILLLQNLNALERSERLKQLPEEKQKRIQDLLAKIKREEPEQQQKKGITLAEMKKSFPDFFKGIPAKYEQALIDYANKVYPTKTFAELETFYKKGPIEVRAFRWQALGNHFGFDVNFDGNAVFFAKNLLKGIQSNMNAREYNTIAMHPTNDLAEIEHKKKALNELVGVYKIHLMPKGSLTDIILTLIEGLQKDTELRKLIYKFKVRPNPDLNFNGNMLAAVIIYPAQGKENAQKALDKIYALFKNVPGTGIAPRYNARVNDLIWVAQGDGDFKDVQYAPLYEKNRVYYRPDITGKVENYHLVNPETGKEIV